LTRDVTCREFVEFLADYVAGELPPQSRSEFDLHLARCPSCVAYMNTYCATQELARAALAAPDDPVPGEVPEELVQAVLAARARRRA
jgi:anti-sigma factor RsiW